MLPDAGAATSRTRTRLQTRSRAIGTEFANRETPSRAVNAGILPVGSARWEFWRRKALLGRVFRSLGWQQGRRLPPKRIDLFPVVLVRDLPGAVVELELLELPEDAISLLRLCERLVGSAPAAREAPSPAGTGPQRRRPRPPPAARRAGAQGSRAGERLAAAVPNVSRRCSLASGQRAIAAPARKTKPAIQSRLTSGFTSTSEKNRLAVDLVRNEEKVLAVQRDRDRIAASFETCCSAK